MTDKQKGSRQPGKVCDFSLTSSESRFYYTPM